MSESFKCKPNDPCTGSGVTGRQIESSMAVFSIVTSLFADAVSKRRFFAFRSGMFRKDGE